jgi:hypothetical protein
MISKRWSISFNLRDRQRDRLARPSITADWEDRQAKCPVMYTQLEIEEMMHYKSQLTQSDIPRMILKIEKAIAIQQEKRQESRSGE